MDKEYVQLLEYLRKIGLENISKSEKKSLYQRLQKGSSLEQVKKELELLYALNRVLIDSYSEVSVANMNRINNEIDTDLLLKLFVVYENIKGKGLSNLNTLSEFKKVSLRVLKENRKVNLELEKIVNIATTHIQLQQEALYFTMLSKEKADVLLANCYKRARLSLQKCQVSNLADVVDCLKSNFRFSDEDLIKVSNQCATLFALSNAEKLINLDNTLKGLRQYISEQLTISNKSIDASKFLNRNFKDILTSSASIAISDSSTLENTIRFLKGEELGKIVPGVEGEFARLKGKFTPAQLAKIYSKSITCLATSMSKIGESCKGISEAYKKYFGQELNLDNIVNGRNFASLTTLRKEDYQDDGKIGNIFSLLSSFVSPNDMQNLLENNYGFLRASVEDVALGIQEAILESKNNDELQKQILRRIKGQFSRNKGTFVPAQREESIAIDKRKDVKIKNMEETEILNLLDKLKTSQSKIDEWKKSWNKEEREYRELEIQIDLEDVLQQTKNLKEMLDFDLLDVNDFATEISIIQDLFKEILEERDIVLSENKISKKLMAIVESINLNVDYITKDINKKIDRLNREYARMLADTSEEFEKVYASKERLLKLTERLKEREEEIAILSIDEGSLKQEKEEIDRIADLIENVTKLHKKLDALEAKCNKRLDEWGDMMLVREKEAFVNNPLKILDNSHMSAKYMFSLYVYILCRDDLIYPPDDGQLLDLNDDDLNMSIEEYLKLLGIKESLVAKEIYDGFNYTLTKSHESFEEICDKLEEYDKYNENINTTKKAIKALQSLHNELNKKYSEEHNILRSKGYLVDEVAKYDNETLNEEMEKLASVMAKYQEEIEKWNSKKM